MVAKARTSYRPPRYITRYYRSRRRTRHGFTFSTAVVAGFVPMILDVVHGYQTGGIESAGNDLLANLTGYNAREKKWDFQLLLKGLGPAVAGVALHKLAGKLGINRALARAGVPWVRI